jgi:hypothetical protein
MGFQATPLEILNRQKSLCQPKLLNKITRKDRRFMCGGQTYWQANSIGQNGLKV